VFFAFYLGFDSIIAGESPFFPFVLTVFPLAIPPPPKTFRVPMFDDGHQGCPTDRPQNGFRSSPPSPCMIDEKVGLTRILFRIPDLPRRPFPSLLYGLLKTVAVGSPALPPFWSFSFLRSCSFREFSLWNLTAVSVSTSRIHPVLFSARALAVS